jgi:hypothetical protein
MPYSDRRDGPSRRQRKDAKGKAEIRRACQNATKSVVRRSRKAETQHVGPGPHSANGGTKVAAAPPVPAEPVRRVWRLRNRAGRVMEVEAANESEARDIVKLNGLVRKPENAIVVDVAVPSL